ncbi:MAG TPA: hypothetical protein VF064_12355 [Pyrinomonadaceae bacterium]
MRFDFEMQDERRRHVMKRALEALGWLAAICLFFFAGHAVLAQDARGGEPAAQQQQQNRGRRAGERRDARDATPASIMREARTVFVRETRHLDKVYLEYKLQKYNELREWELMLVDREDAADLVIQIEKTALNYIFTIVDPRTRAIVASGKTVAINGLVAAENLGREIIKKIRDVRAGPDRKGRRKKPHDEDEDEWSES